MGTGVATAVGVETVVLTVNGTVFCAWHHGCASLGCLGEFPLHVYGTVHGTMAVLPLAVLGAETVVLTMYGTVYGLLLWMDC